MTDAERARELWHRLLGEVKVEYGISAKDNHPHGEDCEWFEYEIFQHFAAVRAEAEATTWEAAARLVEQTFGAPTGQRTYVWNQEQTRRIAEMLRVQEGER